MRMNNNLGARRNVRSSKQMLVESIIKKIRPVIEKALNETSKYNVEEIFDDLILAAEDYDDLDGVELTMEDAETVIEYMKNGLSKNKAIEKVLDDICDVISDGWDE